MAVVRVIGSGFQISLLPRLWFPVSRLSVPNFQILIDSKTGIWLWNGAILQGSSPSLINFFGLYLVF